jgi:hypothetical protein
MAPASCALDATALARQLGRYRTVGRESAVVARDARRIVVDVSPEVPGALVQELVAVERGCCPFLHVDWRPAGRRLTVAVGEADHAQALSAIAAALAPATPV